MSGGGGGGSSSTGDGSGSGGSAARYERLEQIGSGTFGHAWLVRSRASGRQYVVKEIKVTALPEQEREQSVNEVAILSQCKHVNIIRYKEAFIDQLTGSLNIVMEYADGGDLYARIVNQRATNDHFPEELILNWFIQITFAVQYLHSKNILHRDLKTQNIFLTSENLVKVGDFGIARTLRSTQELATTAIGTPYYLSPEICQRQPYNHKSDQWAVGCIVYEMCCLTHPFNASSFENLVLKILQARYSPIPSHYSLLLRDLVTVLLRTQPERRPSAEQVLMIPALKPYVDSYVEWQNAAMSPRGSHRATGSSAPGSSNGSDDRDSLTSSQEEICVSSMSTDSLETRGAKDQPEAAGDPAPSTPPPAPPSNTTTPAPTPVSEVAPETEQQSGRRQQSAWRSQYANQLEAESDWDGYRARVEQPAVARRRSEDAGSPVEVVSAAPRQRSSSLSSLSPESRRRRAADGQRVNSPHTPGNGAVKPKGRGQSSRGPSALIRQVLKNKFSRQEAVRPRSASDPAEPSDPSEPSEPRSCPRRDRSPTRVFRRPSLSVARAAPRSPHSPRSSRPNGGSRSPVRQSRSPVAGGSGRSSPPLNTRNARFLDAPAPRPSGPTIARPVERRPVSRSSSTISATSNMSTGSTVGNSGPAREQPTANGERSSSHGEGASRGRMEGQTPAISEPAGEAAKKQQQQQQRPRPAQRSDSSVSSSSTGSAQERPANRRRLSLEVRQHQGSLSSRRDDSPTSLAGKTSRQESADMEETDSDSQESTLVSRLPDVNHNSIQLAGGQLHARSAECAGGTCCSLICAQCRYAKDEELARLMWSARLRPGTQPDDTALLQHLAKTLGGERLNAVLGRLLASWEGGAEPGQLLAALGKEQLYLLPLLVQAVQLRAAAGRPAASAAAPRRSPSTR
ncbi:serine/threonine-protein kinase Nek4-like [Amphibalanus amphitrite]|uniref:serine/threonine-protein kinase Nek4-like n=1 Tax=Amphibalanus amphitrite TaxID=1232801 RepID=UPI001C8FE48A|nr:serine/threonine-protein kinase Nek4-like [Amphibalanus amphitrite]